MIFRSVAEFSHRFFAKFKIFEIAAVQKYENLVELEKCCQTHIFLQNFDLIQPRTSRQKFAKFCKNNLLIFPILPIFPVFRVPVRGAAPLGGRPRAAPTAWSPASSRPGLASRPPPAPRGAAMAAAPSPARCSLGRLDP